MNEPQAAPAPLLRVVLPGVVSWSRPRLMRGGVRYPAAYAQARDMWSLLVAQAVRDARWTPPPAARYCVTVAVYGGGKRDLDRVCTAVLDALQAGSAVPDDCLVDALTATRVPGLRDHRPSTMVQVAPLTCTGLPPRRPAPDPPEPRAPGDPEAAADRAGAQ